MRCAGLNTTDHGKIIVAVLSQSVARSSVLFDRCIQNLGAGFEVLRGSWQDLGSCARADALILGSEGRLDEKSLSFFPRLSVVAKYGVGIDNVDLPAGSAVRLLHAPGVNRGEVAELTLGLMLSLLRNISSNDQAVRRGLWQKRGGRSLCEQRVGIWGVGAIGQKVAELCAFLGADIIGCDLSDQSEFLMSLGGKQVAFHELLTQATVLSVHVPLTPQTRQGLRKAQLAQMGRGSYIVNTARGAILDEDDLAEALISGQIAGAALDVFAEEPLAAGSALFKCENVIFSPHSAGNSNSAKVKMTDAACALVKEFFHGRSDNDDDRRA